MPYSSIEPICTPTQKSKEPNMLIYSRLCYAYVYFFRFRCRSRLGPRYTEEQPKSCCGLLVSRPGSLRWFIALIALVAVCCVLVGTVLGAMRPAGRDHLTVSLLMIGNKNLFFHTAFPKKWQFTTPDYSPHVGYSFE